MSTAVPLRIDRPVGDRRRGGSAPPNGRPAGWVPELHGLRGLALALVVLFHLFGGGRVSGGVDVFLVVSGFLATGALVRRAERGVLNPFAYWGRTFWRLAVPALLALVGTALLTAWLLPRTVWEQTGREILASATYWVNWEMIAGQLAYGAAGPQTSPVQHFWSLSVQGQFFAVWPLVVLAVVGTARAAGRGRLGPRATLTVVTAVLTAASFWFAVRLHAMDQAVAYFHSGARFWELGLGALAALVLPWLRVPAPVRPALAWLGLAMVVACGFVLDGGSEFPGPSALWPVTATLLVVLGSEGAPAERPAGGAAPDYRGPRRLLETRFLRWVADRSYSLYLWHWPLLIAFLHLRGEEAVDLAGGAVVLAASVALAWFTDLTAARGAQWSGRRVGDVRSLVAAVLATALVVVPLGLWVRDAERDRAQALAELGEPSSRYPGAAVLTDGVQVGPAEPRPGVLVAGEDRSHAELTPGCVQSHGRVLPDGVEVIACPLHEPESPTRTVALVGDSHTLQWSTAFERIAQREGWRLVLYAKQGCRMQDPEMEVSGFPSCRPWNERLEGALAELHPDAVVTVGTYTGTRAGEAENVAGPQVSAWRKLDARGIPVIALRDNMRFESPPVDCVAEHGADPRCGRDRDEILRGNPLETYPGIPDSTVVMDLNDALCTHDRCEAVVGNVLVYRDDDHLSATYVGTVTPYLDERLRATAPFLY